MTQTGQTSAFKIRFTQRFLETVRPFREKRTRIDSSRLERLFVTYMVRHGRTRLLYLTVNIMNSLMDAIYQAREGPGQGKLSILAEHQDDLAHLRKVCQQMTVCSHKKTRALGREFLNDWDAIFRVLEHPTWPTTNNEAERALRHWVIMRKITQGTRSPQGSRALALFASVITTCRLRGHSPLLYIRDVITLRRQGLDAPKIPVAKTPIGAV